VDDVGSSRRGNLLFFPFLEGERKIVEIGVDVRQLNSYHIQELLYALNLHMCPMFVEHIILRLSHNNCCRT